MNRFKQLRTKLGLTQEQISNYLGVVRAVWSMAESGFRDLPISALVKLSQMEVMVSQPPGTDESIKKLMETNFNLAKIELNKELALLEHKYLKLNRKIEELEQKDSRAIQQLNIAISLLRIVPPPTERDKRWLELLEMQARENLNVNQKAIQWKMQIELEMITAGIHKMKEIIESGFKF